MFNWAARPMSKDFQSTMFVASVCVKVAVSRPVEGFTVAAP